jgi:SP family sugar:H+ symporter-like MFS transporter
MACGWELSWADGSQVWALEAYLFLSHFTCQSLRPSKFVVPLSGKLRNARVRLLLLLTLSPSSYQLFITIGIFTAACINFGTEARTDTGSYRIPMGVGYIWALILGGGMLFMPESPRYDIKNGNADRAFDTMTKFYGVSRTHRVVAIETKEINAALEAASGDHPWYETFTAPRMLYRVLLGMALQSFQQLTGANYFFYYGTTIFAGVGIDNSYVTAMILGGVNVGSTFLGLYMVEHYGRRRCLYYGAIWMFVCFMVFASIGHFVFNSSAEGSHEQYIAGVVMIVFACLFIAAFASTWGPMVWAVIGEMFPYRYRAVAMSLAVSANWFCKSSLTAFVPHPLLCPPN